MELDKLKAYRQAAYQHLGKAPDATFELTDAVLLTRTAYCLTVPLLGYRKRLAVGHYP